MPVLKIKNNGVWEQVGGIPDHTHVIDDITDFPTALPNPNQLTFTGATEGVYDGTNALTVNIPSAPDIPTPTQDDAGKVPVASESGNYVLQTFEAAKDGKSAYQYAQDGGYAGTEEEFSKKLAAGTLVVEISNNNGTLTANKTYAEIKEAFLNGTTIYLYDAGYHYHLIQIDDEFSFRFGEVYVEPGTLLVEYAVWVIREDNTVSHYTDVTDDSHKMDKNNPTGTGSFSLNRKAGTVVGANSHAEGSGATASGWYSHAEGRDTTASNDCSHAEGDYTTASGKRSHAEGSITTASGNNSHAEGSMTSASGGYSHAEGQDTTASGERSHAEGQGTSASGTGSHTEGYYTKASSSYQHAQGKYNIEDSSNVYADIIGNGTKSKPSNAATVDWSGNAWYAGDVYVGSTSGTNKDEGSKKLATEDSVSGKMDKNNPTGTGSFSLNRKSGSIIGTGSHTEGYSATASGDYSHAEGYSATASGNYSHAEGGNTTASGQYSHAEGTYTKASGEGSHAEGSSTTASGYNSHAEGLSTTAASSEQHVQGKFNIEDSPGVYADIIGNGTSLAKCSNAATVDWHGNAWYAGDVYVGSTSGTNKDEGSKKLATEEYVDNSVIVPAPSSADNGKYLGCENGVAKWMPAEASGGGAGNSDPPLLVDYTVPEGSTANVLEFSESDSGITFNLANRCYFVVDATFPDTTGKVVGITSNGNVQGEGPFSPPNVNVSVQEIHIFGKYTRDFENRYTAWTQYRPSVNFGYSTASGAQFGASSLALLVENTRGTSIKNLMFHVLGSGDTIYWGAGTRVRIWGD